MPEGHVHTYDEDGDCTRCGDDVWAPKPLPPEPVIPLMARLKWRLWDWVTWPLQVRVMKRYGFRRTGWMTWEYDGNGGPLDD